MNLRKLLHTRFVASIENAHSKICNQRMVDLLKQRSVEHGEHLSHLADLLSITRESGKMSLDQAKQRLGWTSRTTERILLDILKKRHGIWREDTIVLAPFQYVCGDDAWRYVHPQIHASMTTMARLDLIHRIARRPGALPILDETSPNWVYIAGKVYAKRLSILHGVPVKLSDGTFDRLQKKNMVGATTSRVGALTSAVHNSMTSQTPGNRPSGGSHLRRYDIHTDLTTFSLRSKVEYARERLYPEVDVNMDIIQDDSFPEQPSDQPMTSDEQTPPINEGRKVAKANSRKAPKKEPAPKAGANDPQFESVWMQALRVCEKHDEQGVAATDGDFGGDGVGPRGRAWTEWQNLPEAAKAEAEAKTESTYRWREAMGWKRQWVAAYLSDRSWRKLPANFTSTRRFTALSSAEGRSAGRQSTDYWREGLIVWLRGSNPALLPGSLCPSEWSRWPQAHKDAFKRAAREHAHDHPESLPTLKDRAPAAWAYVTENDPGEQLPEVILSKKESLEDRMRRIEESLDAQTKERIARISEAAAKVKEANEDPEKATIDPDQMRLALAAGSMVRAAMRHTSVDDHKPRYRVMTQADIAAYCASVGVSSEPVRITRARRNLR